METIRPAGFWVRGAASLLDALIVGLPWGLLLWGLDAMTMPKELFDALGWVGLVIGLCYSVGFLLGPWQATPGKRIMRIYVSHADHHTRISLLQSILRNLVLGAGNIVMMAFFISTPEPYTPQQIERMEMVAQKQENNIPLTEDEILFQESVADADTKIVAYGAKLLGICALGSIYYLIISIMISTNRRKLGLHDRLAGSCVLRGTPAIPESV